MKNKLVVAIGVIASVLFLSTGIASAWGVADVQSALTDLFEDNVVGFVTIWLALAALMVPLALLFRLGKKVFRSITGGGVRI